MKATTLNTIFCSVLDAALVWHSFVEWDVFSAISSAFGYTLLCAGLWLTIKGLLKGRE